MSGTEPRISTESQAGVFGFVKAVRIGVCAALALVGGRAQAETIGLFMTSWHVERAFTKDGNAECPDGFNSTIEKNFKAQFKAKNRAGRDHQSMARPSAASIAREKCANKFARGLI